MHEGRPLAGLVCDLSSGRRWTATGDGGAAGSVSRYIIYNLAAVLGPNKRMVYYIGGGGAPGGATTIAISRLGGINNVVGSLPVDQLRALASTFLKFTKMPCAVSGLK